VDLVILSVFELGFGKQNGGSRASITDIYARAELLGFELCPPEIAPQLRLRYLEQPAGEVLGNLSVRGRPPAKAIQPVWRVSLYKRRAAAAALPRQCSAAPAVAEQWHSGRREAASVA
jgi:hypothetical protein